MPVTFRFVRRCSEVKQMFEWRARLGFWEMWQNAGGITQKCKTLPEFTEGDHWVCKI